MYVGTERSELNVGSRIRTHRNIRSAEILSGRLDGNRDQLLVVSASGQEDETNDCNENRDVAKVPTIHALLLIVSWWVHDLLGKESG
jgi:hypothetical protein